MSKHAAEDMEIPITEGQRFFVGGNWKVATGDRAKLSALVDAFNAATDLPASCEVAIAPTALHASWLQERLRKDWAVCAQNISTDKGLGAYTGELTAELFHDWGVGWTLTGHSERRRRKQTRNLGHDEGVDSVAAKTAHALSVGMQVILCIGETLKDREEGKTMDVCFEQLQAVANVVDKKQWHKIVIAYEPVWAIGTGVTATPEQAQEVHAELRKWMMEKLSSKLASNIRIIYGGSVKPSNCQDLMAKDDIDGFLVGGASLIEGFLDIVRCCPPAWDAEAREAKRAKREEEVRAIGLDGKPTSA